MSAVFRIDLLISACILLVASGAFLIAIKDVLSNSTRAAQPLPPLPAPTPPSVDALPKSEPVVTTCPPLQIPRVYVDYGYQRKLLDNPAPLDFEMVTGNDVESRTVGPDGVFLPETTALAATGIDEDGGTYVFVPSALPESMRASPYMDTFAAFEGPTGLATRGDNRAAPYDVPADEVAPGMETFTLATQANKGLFELVRTVPAASPSPPSSS